MSAVPTIYVIAWFLLLAGAFVVFRVVVRRDYARLRRLTAVSALAETAVFAAWANISLIYLPADWPKFHLGVVLALVGQIMLWGGIGFTTAGMITLGWQRLFGQPGKGLQQTGLYRYSRNPQLVAFFFIAVGFAILWPSWYALGWTALYMLIAYLMLLTEEEHLSNVYGETYDQYCKEVQRFVGRKKQK